MPLPDLCLTRRRFVSFRHERQAEVVYDERDSEWPSNPSEVLLTRSQQISDITVPFKVCEVAECIWHTSNTTQSRGRIHRCFKPPSTPLLAMRDMEPPHKFWWSENGTILNSLATYSRTGRRDSSAMGGVWIELSGAGFWVRGIFFIAIVTILMLTSCFIGNYRAQVSPIQATHRRPVARPMLSPFGEVSSNYAS